MFSYAACEAPCPFDSAQRCTQPRGHSGLHTVTLTWDSEPAAADDAQTVKFPPIRETIRRRPPVPGIEELSDRAELIEAMGRELQRELRELRAGEDRADEDDR